MTRKDRLPCKVDYGDDDDDDDDDEDTTPIVTLAMIDSLPVGAHATHPK